jgi:hypothetical protein
MSKNPFVEKAEAVARASGADLHLFATENRWIGVGCGPVGQHRDSDPLDRSNFRIILKDMKARLPEGTVEVAYFRHWAVGWVEEIFFNPSPEALAIAQEWQDRLSDYPIADEDDFMNLEWQDNHPEGDRYCYSEERDCGCDRPNVNDPEPESDSESDETL